MRICEIFSSTFVKTPYYDAKMILFFCKDTIIFKDIPFKVDIWFLNEISCNDTILWFIIYLRRNIIFMITFKRHL